MTIDDLRKEILSLPEAERIELRESLGWTATSNAIIEIHDWKGQDRKYPLAIVRRVTAESIVRRVKADTEIIDIIATVRKHPISIAHPAIVIAIRRWQEIIICQSKLTVIRSVELSDTDAWISVFALESDAQRRARIKSGLSRWEYSKQTYRDKKSFNKLTDEEFEELQYKEFYQRTMKHINFAPIAESHLKSIAEQLVGQARRTAWPAAYAFEVYRREVFKASYDFLKLVFETYRKTQQTNVFRLISQAEKRFREYGFGESPLSDPIPTEMMETISIGFDDVRAFLNSNEGKKVLEGRQQYEKWKNTFDDWRFPGIKRSSRRKNKSRSETQTPYKLVSRQSLTPKVNWYNLTETDYGFNLPTVPAHRE